MTYQHSWLVTGGTGYIGSRLLHELGKNGHPMLFWMSSSQWGRMVEGKREVLGNYRGPEEVHAVFESVRPSHVAHLATSFLAGHEPRDIETLIDGNFSFTVAVADAAARFGSAMLLTSSAWQRFEGRRESVSLYAALKDAASEVLDYYTRVHGLEVREVFLFDTYGPSDPRGKLVSLLLSSALRDSPVALGHRETLINLTHVDDVVRQLRWVSAQPASRDWVIREVEPISLDHLVRLVNEVVGSPLTVMWKTSVSRPREMLRDWSFGNTVPLPRKALHDGLTEEWSLLVAGS